jgi:hypothetical protein
MLDEGSVDEVAVGEMVITFDGRVLEILNGSEGSLRVHVGRMKAKVSPTRKDRLYVEITARRRNTPREIFEVDASERPAFEALWARVQAAAAAAAGEPGGLGG